MTSDRLALHRTLAAHFFQEQDRLRGGPSPTLCADGYTAELGGNPPVPREGHEQFAVGFYAGFPDLRHTIQHVLATEDGAAVRLLLEGTHAGSFFGIPASGKHVRIPANIFLSFRDGKVQRLQGVFDEAGMLRQIGVLA